MEFIEREIRGVFEIILHPWFDERGFFMRAYDIDLFKEAGLVNSWVQENHSKSVRKGIIRGLHCQLPPYSETKLVRCIKGAVLDVFVDLRHGSETFGEWGCIELSDNNNRMIYIPRGFAHGFCTLTDFSEVLYKVDNYYSREAETGLLWNDEDLNIQWPAENPVLSAKDLNNKTLKEFIAIYGSIAI